MVGRTMCSTHWRVSFPNCDSNCDRQEKTQNFQFFFFCQPAAKRWTHWFVFEIVNTCTSTRIVIPFAGGFLHFRPKFTSTHLDIDDISDFVHFHVRREWNNTVLLVWTREHVPCTTTITFWVCHFVWFVVSAMKIDKKISVKKKFACENLFSILCVENDAAYTKNDQLKLIFSRFVVAGHVWQLCTEYNSTQTRHTEDQFFFSLCVRILINCKLCKIQSEMFNLLWNFDWSSLILCF